MSVQLQKKITVVRESLADLNPTRISASEEKQSFQVPCFSHTSLEVTVSSENDDFVVTRVAKASNGDMLMWSISGITMHPHVAAAIVRSELEMFNWSTPVASKA